MPILRTRAVVGTTLMFVRFVTVDFGGPASTAILGVTGGLAGGGGTEPLAVCFFLTNCEGGGRRDGVSTGGAVRLGFGARAPFSQRASRTRLGRRRRRRGPPWLFKCEGAPGVDACDPNREGLGEERPWAEHTQRVVPNQEQPEGTTSKNRLRSHVDPRPYTTRSTYIAHTNTFLTLLSISHSLLIHRLGP